MKTHNVIIPELHIEFLLTQVICPTREQTGQVFIPYLDVVLYLLLFVFGLTGDVVILQ